MTIQVMSTGISEGNPAETAPADLAKADEASSDQSATAKAEPKAPAKSDTATEENDGEEIDKDESEDDGDEPEAKDTDEGKPKKKGGFQKRIGKLTLEKTEARREAEYWKAEALKHAPKPTESAAQVDPPKAADTAGEPDPDKFETHSEYVKAVVKWDRETAAKEQSAKDSKAALETAQKTQETAHFERVQAFTKENPDFPEVLEGVRKLAISPAVEHLLISSENGPELLYALAKDPAEFTRVNALGPLAAARELGRLESKLAPATSEATRPAPPKQTKAPAPIVPVGSKGGSVAKSIHEIAATGSQREFETLRRKQLEAKG